VSSMNRAYTTPAADVDPRRVHKKSTQGRRTGRPSAQQRASKMTSDQHFRDVSPGHRTGISSLVMSRSSVRIRPRAQRCSDQHLCGRKTGNQQSHSAPPPANSAGRTEAAATAGSAPWRRRSSCPARPQPVSGHHQVVHGAGADLPGLPRSARGVSVRRRRAARPLRRGRASGAGRS
jgi:hypothetical protein